MDQIYYVGYDATHPEDFRYVIPEGLNSYLLVITTTSALFQVDGVISEYPPHTAVLYPPNHSIWYGAAGKPYGNHWLRFTSSEPYVTDFPQPVIPFSISDPEYFHKLFQLLTWETSQLISSSRSNQNAGIITWQRDSGLKHQEPGSMGSNLLVSHLIRILFYKLHSELLSTRHTFHDHKLLALRRKISANPEYPWNVSDMASQLHISTGHLQLIYKQKFNISCMEDVIRFRLFKAKDLLAYTTQSIAEIAMQCGYNNTEHFCRQFRQNIGISPGQFRKSIGV